MTFTNSAYGTQRRLSPRGDTESSYACRMQCSQNGDCLDRGRGGSVEDAEGWAR